MKHHAFLACHPAVNLLYFVLVLTFSMFFLHPLCLAVSLCAALWCAAQLNGGAAVRRSALLLAPTALLAALVNLAFNHQGATILAYLPSGNPLTLESIAYGFAAAAMLAAVVLWFSCWNTVMTSDKLMHLFGRVVPALSLLLSMTLRFVPRFQAKLREVTAARRVPDMDFVVEQGNRLWGCKYGIVDGRPVNEIYASKLGDIFNWNVFDGVATDSFAVDVASTGDFTACCSYLGYPCFFKEEHIYKVYGDKPSNFQVMGSASLGVERGSDESLAIAGETLFYLSRTGIVAWSGGIPQSVSAAFGTQRFRNGVAGSDGTKYFVSLQDTTGVYQLFAFDTRTNLWHREDSTQAVGWGWNEELYCLDATGKLWMNGNARSVPQGAVQEALVAWKAEWADFYEYTTYSSSSTATPEKKGIGKLLLRLELAVCCYLLIIL